MSPKKTQKNDKSTNDPVQKMNGTIKFLREVLLQDPSKIGIIVDSDGWTDVDQLILNSNFYQQANGYELLTKGVLDSLVHAYDLSLDNINFEYSSDGWRIRAVKVAPQIVQKVAVNTKSTSDEKDNKVPPTLLYHGTVESRVKSIMTIGLKKMKHPHVYLCSDYKEMKEVLLRHASKGEKAIVLTVRAQDMYAKGHKFCNPKGNIWTTEEVPPSFVVHNVDELTKLNK